MADADYTPPAITKLSDAPILLFVSFHRAFLAELENLRNLTETATSHDSQLVNHLLTRFHFLQLVYKYHCAAEDEVVFLALDKHVKNVACSYSLEHRSIDEFFESVLSNLQVLVDCGDDAFKKFQELLFSIGTFQVAICRHMMKEEQQVFPMLVKKFSTKEQASLVWQFLCSVPIALLEDFFPWMTSFLSADDQSDIVLCIKEVVPKENLLQELVLSWLSYRSYNHEGSSKHELFHEKCKDDNSAQGNYDMFDPVACLHLWHGALKQDLNRILMELYQIQSSDDTCLSSVIAQLKFLVDVVIFYSNTLDRRFYPTLDESSGIYQSVSYKRLLDRSRLHSLQQLIYCNDKKETPICELVEKLCRELDPFLKEISKNFIFLETEGFPLIGQNFIQNIEQPLLYMIFRMMPLGLLKFVITWFSTQLSEEEIISITHCIKQGGSLVNKALESLLMVWVRFGCSGKSSIRKFRGDLLEIFKSRCSFLIEQNKEDKISSSLHLDEQPCKRSNGDEPNLASASRNSELDPLTHALISTEQCDILYSSGISMHLLSPGTLKALCSFPEFDSESGAVNSILDLESRPLDHIFFYHRALKKDLQYLVHASAKLSEKSGSLKDFQRRFHLLWYLYQLHSESEDTIAFPALETKGRKVENVSCSYSIDHKIEADYFTRVALILDEMSLLDPGLHKYGNLCVKLHDMCISMDKVICDHILREETEVWLLFRECFSVDEQEKIIGHMLGRIRAEILQQMIPWLMAALTMPEQQAIISLWRKATKNTKFDEWLGEWWEGVGECNQHNSVQESNSPLSLTTDQLDAVSKSFSKQYLRDQAAPSGKDQSLPPKISTDVHVGLGHLNVDNKRKPAEEGEDCYKCIECNKMLTGDEKRSEKGEDAPVQANQLNELYVEEQPLAMNQEELETVIRKISRDSSIDAKKKSSMIQNLLTSRWVATQQKLHSDAFVSNDVNEISGQCPSFQDPLNLTFGCKHYKRNCKLLASCCNKLFTCIRCHDEDSDHSIDRRAITKMMCMKCLVIQPIGPMCSSNSCSSFSMGKYYCSICKLFDDERKIYHCPYCNLCRVGMGLGIDYFHCMNCNACMSWTLSVHICREKCFEDNCPICHEYIFTSSSPVKALPCGHLMHSTCFQDYTCTQYTCPICSKSLGNMQVYFAMLDAMLAEENMPDEYAGLTQVVLCNDCEKRGTTPYHWLYHKCPHCGSYNTRLL